MDNDVVWNELVNILTIMLISLCILILKHLVRKIIFISAGIELAIFKDERFQNLCCCCYPGVMTLNNFYEIFLTLT